MRIVRVSSSRPARSVVTLRPPGGVRNIWGEIDDGDPAGLDLWRVPFYRDSGCNAGFTKPIDFIVFDDGGWGLVDETSFADIVYDSDDWDADRHTPSDHCPIVVALDWPTAN
jgi:hypothetical protein